MSQPDNLASSLVSMSSLAICYEYQGTWSTLNLGKVASGVVTQKNKPAHRLNLLSIEREGVLVLGNEEVLGKHFLLAFWPHYKEHTRLYAI